MATSPRLKTGKSAVLPAILTIVLSGTLFAGRNQWTPVGPEGGDVFALAADPQNPATVYAATCGGVFKTADGGANWSAVNSGLAAFDCWPPVPGVLAVDPQNTGTVYALSANQVFKTTDGGTSWKAISTPKTNSLQVLLIAPSNPNTLYASDGLYARGGAGIFKSADGGATWTLASSGVKPPIAVNPQNQDTLYANFSGALSKSTDGGVTWNPANSGLPAVQVIAIDPQTPDTLYAGGGSQIYKSTDGGASWNTTSFGPPALAPSVGLGGVVSLAVHPQNPAVIYALIQQAFFCCGYDNFSWFLATSTDGAASWTLGTDPIPAPGIATITPDPQDVGTLYLATSNGVLKTTDGGGHWNFANSGLRAAQVDSLVVDSQTDGTLFAVTDRPAELFKSTDGGSSWFPSNFGLPSVALGLNGGAAPVAIPSLVPDPQTPGSLYALQVGGGVLFKSEDAGGSWAKIWANTASAAFATAVGPLAIAPEQPSVMYAGFSTCNGSCYSRIGKSIDGGRTWTDLRVALMGPGCCAVISAVAVDPQNPNVVYAGSGDGWDETGGLWKSTDGGVSWVSLSQSFPPPAAEFGDIDSVLIDPRNPSTIYVANDVFSSLYKSTDGGQTWVTSDLGPGRGAAGPLVMDPQDSATLYCVVFDYVKNRDEVLRSTDAGASWTVVGPGRRGTYVNSLAVDPQDPATLYAGTSGGLFVITLDTQQPTPDGRFR